MTKSELITALADKAGTTKSAAASIVDALTDVATAQLATGNEVSLPGIGKLTVAHREARTGRNPATGAPAEIPARVAVKFAASATLKNALNGVAK